MASTTLKTLYPNGHSIAIVSPCNGATVALYAKIINADEGLNSSITNITTVKRVGMDGTILAGSKPQYKNIMFTIDVSDGRITFEDFYSFFNKDSLYQIVMDDKYVINGAISRISYPFFNNMDGYAYITMECDSCFWMTDYVETFGPYTMDYTNSIAITIGESGYGQFLGQAFDPEISITVGALPEKQLKGFWFLASQSGDNDIKINWDQTWVQTTGGIITVTPCTSEKININSGGRILNLVGSYLPDKTMNLVFGHTYLFSLRQSELMTDTETTITIKGKGRYYN